jgi:Mn-dependent DtxR family transcriptional regulator
MKIGASAAAEDYLERILELITTKGYARVVDIAEKLNISQASVTNMLQRLDADGLIHYEKYRGLVLTAQGESVARGISYRHHVLTDFLTLLGITPEVRECDIEGMEHHISPSTLLGIETLAQELKENPKLLKKIQSVQKKNARKKLIVGG